MDKISFYHSCPEFIVRGYNYNVSVAVANVDDNDVYLHWTAGGADGEFKLERDHCCSDGILTAFSAVILPDCFETIDVFNYKFVCGNCESETYCVAVGDAGKMPPLIVTELYLRPKGLNVTQFIEVMNPSSEEVDLYDYKFMVYNGNCPCAEDYICGLSLSNERGNDIIAPFEVAALWPLLPGHHEQPNDIYLTVGGFVEACMDDFPKPEFDLRSERSSVRIIPIEASVYDEELGKYVAIDNISKIPSKTECTTLVLAPRDSTPETGLELAVYRMVYNKGEYGGRDTPVRHSSLWTIDIRKPSEGVVLSSRELISPGRLGFCQAVPDLTLPYPMIVPLYDEGAVLSPDGLALRFAVPAKQIAGIYVDVKMPDGDYRRYRALKNDGVWCVKLDLKDIYSLDTIDYVAVALDGIHKVELGKHESPMSVKLADRCGPYIVETVPAEKYGYDNTRVPQIEINYFDISGVDSTRSIICVDKKNVSSVAVWSDDKVTYIPTKPMKYGDHSFEVMLCDKLGNKTYRKVNFSICKSDALNLYCGEVHAHTAFSDGIAGPDEAYVHARNVGKVDFFAVTDHSHYLDKQLYLLGCDIADKYDDPGKFASLYGYEMTWNHKCGLWGHMNVINSKHFYDDINRISLPDFYDLIKSDEKAIGMFNHPCLHWGNFHDYTAYSEYADKFVCLAEIKGAGYDREYANMLALGWHASPAFNEDNHSYNWTTATKSTTYALAPALTRDNILDAFRRRRTYSTADPTMKIKFRVNGEWMGGRLHNPSVLKVDVDVSTENEAGIGNISLVTEDNIVVASVNVGALREYHWSLKVLPDFDYYYIRVTSTGKYSVTSPVWIEGRNAICVKSLTCSHGYDEYKPNAVSTKIKNLSSRVAKSVKIDFYLTGGGFDPAQTVPYRTVVIPELGAGKSACIKCNIPNVAGLRRVSVVAQGKLGKSQYADTDMVQISPVKICEILPKSPEGVDREGKLIANPFPYIKLCNLSNRDIYLDKYYTRLWISAGKQPVEDRMFHLDGQCIKAGGVLTVWIRPKDSALDVEDFNKHYGINMVEGEDLVIASVPAISSSKYYTRRLDLMCDKELMSRVEYNFVQPPQSDINEGFAITYDVHPTMTGTSVMVSNSAVPSPADSVKL